MTSSLAQPDARSGWSRELWGAGDASFRAILDHPFLTGVRTGSLPADRFLYFLAQDAHYLESFGRALARLAAKAPDRPATRTLAAHATEAMDVEFALHGQLAEDLGYSVADLRAIPAGPTTVAYADFVLAHAHTADFCEGLAGVLPCYWIYAMVGRTLQKAGSAHPAYQRWIDSYADDAYGTSVAEVLDLVDRSLPETATATERCRQVFARGARYEWMFWDAAWRRESWLI